MTPARRGQNLWAYTAQFGNGFSGTLSLEDPSGHNKAGTLDLQGVAFFGLNGTVVNDNGLVANNAGAGFGFRVPDVVANLRVDQAWGFAGISASLHDASGAYYNTAPVVNACAVTGNCVNNGHPEDKYGWALAGGAKFNLPGGDTVGFEHQLQQMQHVRIIHPSCHLGQEPITGRLVRDVPLAAQLLSMIA